MSELLPLPNVSYFLDQATAHTTWLHEIVDIRSDGAVVVYARMVVGPQPAAWRDSEVWTYRDYVFAARALTTRAVREWFAECDAGRWSDVSGQAGQLRLVPGVDANFPKSPSRAQHDPLRYPLPAIKFALTLEGGTQQLAGDYFVGDGCPSFTSSAGVCNAFFNNDFRATGMSAPSTGVMEILFADTRGGFEEVVVRPSAIAVSVSGDDPGLRLELSGEGDRFDVAVPRERTVELPLASGLPKEAWLWLKKGTEWLDYRSLGFGAHAITYDMPEDEVANLSALISTGEDGQLEFKAQLPAKDAESKRKTFKTVAAFAQDAGGIVLFGVEDRSGRLLGISEDEETAKQRFTSMINSIVRPTPKFELSYQQLEDKNILVARIEPSGEIHSVTVETDHHEYYVRRSATTFYARPEDLERVVNARQVVSNSPWA